MKLGIGAKPSPRLTLVACAGSLHHLPMSAPNDRAGVAAAAPFPSTEGVTPFMAQYLQAKSQHPDALLFFRMGDFYELFFEDAIKAAHTLDIALTARGNHKGDPIPMAGVPWHQAEGHLARLVAAGHRVAICEQMENPAEAKKRGAKSIVRREVVRLITPGTLTEESLLEPRASRRLAALGAAPDGWALAWADVSTGELEVARIAPAGFSEAVAALRPAEMLVCDLDLEREAIRAAAQVQEIALTPRPQAKADPRAAARRLKELFGVATLDGFGAFAPEELSALGVLIDYIELTQAGGAPMLNPPRRQSESQALAIDPATRASLEIAVSARGERRGSLLWAIDRTLTAAGARLLEDRLARPLTDPGAIAARHDCVAFFLTRRGLREDLRADLKGAPDLARALQRLALGRGLPRDLAALRDGLARGGRASGRLVAEQAPDEIAAVIEALSLTANQALAILQDDLTRALASDLPAYARDGGVFAAGFDPALDEHRALRDDGRRRAAALQAAYAEESGLPLKLKHSGVLGYHIEATAKQAEALMRPPLNARFIHRQTNAGVIKFTTAELAELDTKIARAGDAALEREIALFNTFAGRAAMLRQEIARAAGALAALDVATALAEWAAETGAVRPEIDASRALVAEGAWHPVVAEALRREGASFTPNDARLDGDGQIAPRLTIITGPNMAGKSTYLRQTALLAILAQAGAFAPAQRLRLGIVDRVFSRVGASDDLSRGRSTFMTEMVETAAILHQAGPRALVILDEIGRGTATYDGLAIAWATAEHLHDKNACRALFATHYHELTALADRLPAGANASLKAREWKGDLVFLHEVQAGPADRSYGVAVAKIAGVPKPVVERARALLARLEAGKGPKGAGVIEDLPLFDAAPARSLGEPSAVEAALCDLDPDSLTPKEALAALYRLKELARRE